MNILFWLDYLFYTCTRFFSNKEEDEKMSGAMFILSLVFMSNASLIVFILTSTHIDRIEFENTLDKWSLVGAIFYLVLSFLFWLRYFKVIDYQAVKMRILNLSKKRKRLYDTISIFYTLGSVLSTLTYAIIFGGKI